MRCIYCKNLFKDMKNCTRNSNCPGNRHKKESDDGVTYESYDTTSSWSSSDSSSSWSSSDSCSSSSSSSDSSSSSGGGCD